VVDRRELFMGAGACMVAAGFGSPAFSHVKRKPDEVLGHVDPELRDGARTVISMGAAISPMTMAKLPVLRQGAGSAVPAVDQAIKVERHMVAVGDDVADCPVYLINSQPGVARPAILHTHGGGLIAGSAKAELRYLQGIAAELGCVIASVEYSLAPEARWPRSTEETYAALRWLYRNAATLGVDPARIAVMGESAGGAHAALLALNARDRKEVPLVAQILIYPMLDDATGSKVTPPWPIGAIGWDAQANNFGWSAFLGRAAGSASVPPQAVPARRSDLKGLAPAFIAIGTSDLPLGAMIGITMALASVMLLAFLQPAKGATIALQWWLGMHGFKPGGRVEFSAPPKGAPGSPWG